MNNLVRVTERFLHTSNEIFRFQISTFHIKTHTHTKDLRYRWITRAMWRTGFCTRLRTYSDFWFWQFKHIKTNTHIYTMFEYAIHVPHGFCRICLPQYLHFGGWHFKHTNTTHSLSCTISEQLQACSYFGFWQFNTVKPRCTIFN